MVRGVFRFDQSKTVSAVRTRDVVTDFLSPSLHDSSAAGTGKSYFVHFCVHNPLKTHKRDGDPPTLSLSRYRPKKRATPNRKSSPSFARNENACLGRVFVRHRTRNIWSKPWPIGKISILSTFAASSRRWIIAENVPEHDLSRKHPQDSNWRARSSIVESPKRWQMTAFPSSPCEARHCKLLFFVFASNPQPWNDSSSDASSHFA